MTTATAPTTNDFRQKAQEIKDNIVDMAGMAKDAARDKACEAKAAVTSRLHAGAEQAGRARDGVLDYVQQNPVKSLLACLCAGAVAGLLISRRR